MTPEQQAAAAIASMFCSIKLTLRLPRLTRTVEVSFDGAPHAEDFGVEAVESLSGAGLCIVAAGRVAELLDANSALVADYRTLRSRCDAAEATVAVQGEALAALRDRVAAAEAAHEQAKRQAGEMLPRRLEAERQRDAALAAAAAQRRADAAEIAALRLALGLNPDRDAEPAEPAAAAPRSME